MNEKNNEEKRGIMIEQFEKLEEEPVWYSYFQRNKDDIIKGNIVNNIIIVLQYDSIFKNAFKFNVFTEEEIVDRDIKIYGAVISKGYLKDVDVAFIKNYLERSYHFTTDTAKIYEAISYVSQLEENKFNPMIDYFNESEENWDKIERSSTFLPEYLGAEKTDITTLITEIFFIGAVAKAFNPFTKFDFSLDIVGDQGTGKTTLLKKLGGQWYVDTIQNFKDKDEYAKMQRALIVNDDEMQATNDSRFDVLKKFLSTESLEYRAPYAHKTVKHAKHFVIARTSNQVDYLKDKTGNRRYLPILSKRKNQVKHPYKDLTQAEVDQFWGEMVAKYKENGIKHPTLEQSESLQQHRENFVYVDELENLINEFLEHTDLDWVTSSDIAEAQLNNIDLVRNQNISKQITNIMNNKQSWERKRISSGRGWKRVTANDT